MTGIHQTLKRKDAGGPANGTWSISGFGDSEGGIPATCSATLGTNGSTSKSGSGSVSNWYTPNTVGIGSSYWMEYSSTGTGTITGGLTAGVRYQLSSARSLGITRSLLGEATRVFTILIYDAASGGNLVATITLTAYVEVI